MSDLKLGAGAYCRRCQVEHRLPTELALPAARELQTWLSKARFLDEAGAAHSTAGLQDAGGGKMFGVLVARDPKDGSLHQLRAFSGQFNGAWQIPGWAPPLFDVPQWQQCNATLEPTIKAATERIEALPKRGSARAEPVAERRELCQRLVDQLNALYRLRNFRGDELGLGAFFEGKSPPTGTGDCCAPKLLNWAALRGLEPLALAEFFWGKAPGNRREHGQYYPSCKAKCGPILGFMLCGCPAAMGDSPAVAENATVSPTCED